VPKYYEIISCQCIWISIKIKKSLKIIKHIFFPSTYVIIKMSADSVELCKKYIDVGGELASICNVF
jgi:hypothetical protein